MNEHAPATPNLRPARSRDVPDFRRLEVITGRLGESIASSIETARNNRTEIDHDTARCIALALGRALSEESALTSFATSGTGNYVSLSDEYLEIYHAEEVSDTVKEWISWLGAYLIDRDGTGSERRFLNPQLPPKLEQLLVRTDVRVDGETFTVHIPASWHSGNVDDLIETLGDLSLSKDEALQAFLSLSDVSAASGDIMESFHESFTGSFATGLDALKSLSPLSDWQNDLTDWCIGHGIDPEALEWNYAVLFDQLGEMFDLVTWKGRVYAFQK